MDTHKTGTTVWSVLLAAAEMRILTKSGVFADMARQYENGWGGFLLNALIYAVVVAVVNIIVSSVIIFRCEYFGVRFDSTEEIQAESGRTAKKALLIVGLFYLYKLASVVF